MAAHREVISRASRSLGIRKVQQTLVERDSGVYRTTLTLLDGGTVIADGEGVEGSFGNALRELEKRRRSA